MVTIQSKFTRCKPFLTAISEKRIVEAQFKLRETCYGKKQVRCQSDIITAATQSIVAPMGRDARAARSSAARQSGAAAGDAPNYLFCEPWLAAMCGSG